MAEGGSFTARIAISGVDSVIRSLQSIGKVGENSFGELAEAIEAVQLAELIAKIEETRGAAEEGFAAIARSAGTAALAFGAAVAGLGIGLGVWAKAGAEAVEELSNLTAEAGGTVEGMTTLRGALAQLGGETGELGNAFRFLAARVQSSWEDIQKAGHNAADLAAKDLLSVRAAAEKVTQAQQASASAPLGEEGAALGLLKARQELAKLHGVTVDPQIEEAQKLRAARLAVAEAEEKVIQAQQKSRQVALDLAEAEQKAADAAKKATDDRLNSNAAVGAALGKIISGQATAAAAAKEATLSVDNVVKGLILNTGATGEELKGFTGNLRDITAQAPEAVQVLYKLADFLKNSGDTTLNTAVAKSLFGRGVNQTVISALGKEGSVGVKKMQEELEKLGFVINEHQVDPLEHLKSQYNDLGSKLGILSTQMAATFAPSVSAGLQAFVDYLDKNRSAIVEWTQSLAEGAAPTIKKFFESLTLGNLDKFTTGLKTIAEATGIIASAFGKVIEVIGKVGSAITDNFGEGGAATAAMIFFFALIAKLAGPWGLLATAIAVAVQKIVDSLSDAGEGKEKKSGKSESHSAPEQIDDTAKSVEKLGAATKKAVEPVAAGKHSSLSDLFDMSAHAEESPHGAAAGAAAALTPHQEDVNLFKNNPNLGELFPRGTYYGDQVRQFLASRETLAGLGGDKGSELSLKYLGRRKESELYGAEYKNGEQTKLPRLRTSYTDEFSREVQLSNADRLALAKKAAATEGGKYTLPGFGQTIDVTRQLSDARKGAAASPGGVYRTGSMIHFDWNKRDREASKQRQDKEAEARGDYAPQSYPSESQNSMRPSLYQSQVVDPLKKAFNFFTNPLSQRGDVPNPELGQFARGGAVFGPGTSTSDSIPARLSRDEYVVSAAGTRSVGSRFLDMINRADGGIAGALAISGMDSSRPDFSGGSGGNHTTVDLRTDHGTFRMMAPADTVSQLNKASVQARTVRAGDRPLWYS